MPIIDLKPIENEHQKSLFINHLDALIQTYQHSSFGRSYVDSTKNFVNETEVQVSIDSVDGVILIKIVSDLKNRLLHIEYEDLNNNVLTEKITALIQTALLKSLGSVKQIFYRRFHYTYFGEQLDGEYWVKGVRIAPVYYDEETKQIRNIERYFSIELEVAAIDEHDANAISNEMADIYAARLSLFLDVGISPPRSEQKWFLSENYIESSILRQTGYYGYDHKLERMPKKKEICKLGAYHESLHPYLHYVGETLKLPTETRKIFSALEKSDQLLQLAFNKCCFLYQQALTAGRYYPTVELSYLVAAIDALTKCESEKLIHFGEFIRFYSGADGNVDEFIDFMHGTVRSAHFHAGEFSIGEYSYTRLSTIRYSDVNKRMLEHNYRTCRKLIRNAIANWCQLLIKNTCESA
ncbi:hypothetical protein HQQ92_04280 [Shewanella sp. DC2-4]|uniref:hypothetical protein n=1 Tax=Shewanella sp. DC2-4 TaxID=2739431 RepID=UPI0015669376|nr:hypothetical protein [Shewanella sp. DC2-4]NRD31030.1 hypothetical protein [Shewanella sp. DC2-4]